MSFWEIWTGAFTAIAVVVGILSSWFLIAPLHRAGQDIAASVRRPDEKREGTSLPKPDSGPLTTKSFRDALAPLGSMDTTLKSILDELKKQNEHLRRLSSMTDARLPRRDDEWVGELRLRRREGAAHAGNPQPE